MFCCGKYGKTVKPFNTEVQKKCIGDAEVYHLPSGRPDLKPELPRLWKKRWLSTKSRTEDVLSYALFPQVAD